MSTPAHRLPRALARAAAVWVAVLALTLSVGVAPANAAASSVATPAAVQPAAAPEKSSLVAAAADLTGFDAGNIISDAVFFDSSTMTEAQIQSFLQSKVSACQSGYTCLKDKYDTSRTTTADAMCGAYSGGVNERASRIIYKVAQACGINPQVFLVMLQKEQGLVTHTAPSEWRYTIAMGQGCPDTAACDTRYYGFFNQVYGAAWQLKRYANPPGTSQYFTWYAPGKTWNILYHPNSACGTSPVYVRNQATSNLYYYTPYQPNAAALRAGYGEGDGCSSYGNRNFYNYFTDWFGSTQETPRPPAPTISSVDQGSFIIAVDTVGALWGYPLQSGAWGTRIKLGEGLTNATQVLSVGDLDGDGHRDLITLDAQRDAYLRAGLADGRFGDPRRLDVDWSGAELVTNAGDFDGDGIPDVFTVDAAGSLSLWRGTSFGSLASPIEVGWGWQGMDLIVGGWDLDGDERFDLVARGRDGRLWLYSGAGGGRWKGSKQIGNGWQALTSILSPGDVTGDGKADLVARTASGSMITYSGDGRGRISTGPTSGSGWQVMVALAGTGPEATAPRSGRATDRDINRDGAPDVFALDGSGRLMGYLGNGNGGWRGSTILSEGWASTDRLVVLGDFTGDARPDVARIGADGTMLLYEGDGQGQALTTGTEIGWGWGGLDIVVGGLDFDGDSRTDVLARTANGDLMLYRGDGRGSWIDSRRVGTGWNSFDAILSPGDFDGDGHHDVLARRSDGTLRLYPTDGRGGWKAPRNVGWGWQSLTAIVGPGNFDGKGGVDILARSSTGDLLIYRGDGSGGWLGSGTIGWGWNGFAQLG